MYKLLEFIRNTYVVLLFVVFEALAINYYANSSAYTQARLLSGSNVVVGGLHRASAGVHRYFSLGHENELLLGRVVELEERLAAYEQVHDSVRHGEYLAEGASGQYRLATASVVANTVNRQQNLITLDKGRRDGVVEQMGVLSSGGAMVGYVVACSERYAVAVSVLNTSFRASGKIAGTDYFGSVYWEGVSQYEVTLGEVSKYADPQPGQEIVSAGFSLYFPADVLIGWVESAELNQTRTAYTIKVRLAAEMSRLGDVVLVENRDLSEVQALQQDEQVKKQQRY